MQRIRKRWLLATTVAFAIGCAVEPPSRPQRPVSKTSPLAKIHPGMTFTQVVEALGPPTSQSRRLTGHAFNPFATGNQGQITEFHYLKLGRVVFAGPDFQGQGASVIAVEEDPAEPGHE
jgi:hypothetical protein